MGLSLAGSLLGAGVHCLLGPSPHSQLPRPPVPALWLPAPSSRGLVRRENLLWEIYGLGKGTCLRRAPGQAVAEFLQLQAQTRSSSLPSFPDLPLLPPITFSSSYPACSFPLDSLMSSPISVNCVSAQLKSLW